MFKFNLQPEEKILTIHRQTEGILFKPAILIILSIYLPWYFLFQYELASKYSRLLLSWTIVVIFFALNKYLLWLLNLFIITNKRIILVNYTNLFNKKIVESPIERILNVSYEINGLWNTLIKSGTIISQIQGLNEPIVCKNINNPSKVKDYLWKIHLSKNIL